MHRITYHGAYVRANGKQLNRITSFGSSSSMTSEKLRELGNEDFFVAEDLPSVDVSIEGREWGTLDNFLAFLNKESSKKYIHLRKDCENAKVNFTVPVKVDDGAWTQLIEDAYLTSYNLSYSVTGDATEGYSFNANNKYWYKKHVDIEEKDVTSKTATFVHTGTLLGVQGLVDGDYVPLNKVTTDPVNDYDYTVEGKVITVKSDSITKVRGIFALDTYPVFVPDTEQAGTKRRAEVEVFLVKDHSVADFNADAGTNALDNQAESKLLLLRKLQTASIDASLDREDLFELGRLKPYHKALTLPLNITINLDFIAEKNEILAYLMGEDSLDSMDVYDISKLVSDLGLIVNVYEKRDVDGPRKKLRSIQIPKIMVTSEGFNLATEGNATSNFSFSAEDLAIIDKTS